MPPSNPRDALVWWRAERHRDHPVGTRHGSRTGRRRRRRTGRPARGGASPPRAPCRRGGSPSVSAPPTLCWGPTTAGTFAGYGVDLRVTLSPGTGDTLTELPLCALIAGWVRGQANPEARAEVRVYAADHDVDAALARGRRLRAEIDEAADPIGVLVVADGAHTLTPPAPGGYDPDSIPTQAALDDALAAGDAAALTRLPDAIVGRVGLPGAGRADRRRRRGRPRSSIAARPTASATSPASGSHDATDRDHRPDGHRQIGAGAGRRRTRWAARS